MMVSEKIDNGNTLISDDMISFFFIFSLIYLKKIHEDDESSIKESHAQV